MNKNIGKVTAEFKWARRVVLLIGVFLLAGWISMIRFGLTEDFWLAMIITAGTILYAVLAQLIIRSHRSRQSRYGKADRCFIGCCRRNHATGKALYMDEKITTFFPKHARTK
jgi:hypothetical protein